MACKAVSANVSRRTATAGRVSERRFAWYHFAAVLISGENVATGDFFRLSENPGDGGVIPPALEFDTSPLSV